MFASIACALHCISLPLILTLSTLGVLSFMGSPWFEWGMILVAAFIALKSLSSSYPKHQKVYPIALGIAGFCFLIFCQFLFHDHLFHLHSKVNFLEASLMATGGILVAAGHWQNIKLLKEVNLSSIHP